MSSIDRKEKQEQPPASAVWQEESVGAAAAASVPPEETPEPADAAVCENQAQQDPVEELKLQVADLTQKLSAQQDKYLRLMAEFDNYKRRNVREQMRTIETANEHLLQQLIEVRENFERALKPQDAAAAPADALVSGMKLIFGKFDEILKKNGLEPFAVPGDVFDPQLHDALMRRPHESIAEGHIAEIYEKGYRLKDKIIRHARVVISDGAPKPGAPVPDDAKEERI